MFVLTKFSQFFQKNIICHFTKGKKSVIMICVWECLYDIIIDNLSHIILLGGIFNGQKIQDHGR